MAKKTIKQAIAKTEKTLDVVPSNAGRPTKYLKEYCQLLIEHMNTGYSYESFAGIIEVNRDTLYAWEKEFPQFSDAKKIAIEKGLMFWEKIGIDHIINSSESSGSGEGASSSSKSLNASAWIFNMKNRFKWRDKQADEASDININLTLADQMAKARLRVAKK